MGEYEDYYLHVFFGEVHPYQIRAQSFDQAVERAFEHLSSIDFDVQERVLVESGEGFRVYDIHGLWYVSLYQGKEPWTTKEECHPGSFFDGGPDETLPKTTDFSRLGSFAVVIDMETGTVMSPND
jgi:hypothetical protein